MKLTVIGCAGTYPGPQSPCSCYLVEHDGFRLVLDFGNGALGTLAQYTDDVLDLDAVFLSHLHGDHCLDLVPYTYARRYPPGDRPGPLPVYGPEGTQERLENSFDQPRPGYLADVYDIRPVQEGRLRIGPFEVTLARTTHPVECHAIRLDAGGESLVYSGDTAACETLVNLARGVDLFVCEATYPVSDDNPPGVHMSAAEAGEHAAKADVGRLVLTHLIPWANPDESLRHAREAFRGPAAVARTGAVYGH